MDYPKAVNMNSMQPTHQETPFCTQKSDGRHCNIDTMLQQNGASCSNPTLGAFAVVAYLNFIPVPEVSPPLFIRDRCYKKQTKSIYGVTHQAIDRSYILSNHAPCSHKLGDKQSPSVSIIEFSL